jgi:hypothetical protein
LAICLTISKRFANVCNSSSSRASMFFLNKLNSISADVLLFFTFMCIIIHNIRWYFINIQL